ncbi:hypothetical protein F1B92_08285, partial [Campylobacter sp. FMV-PI01]|nr:hypothetical protein [Campylobacter portucalensis]
MATYTLTINIEAALTAHIGDSGNTSISPAGHMWYSVQKDNEKPKEFGFASVSGKPFDSGRIATNDGQAYVGNPAYSRTIEISEEQYNKLLNSPSGFNTDKYDVVANNCISFTWESLKNAGFETSDFKGAFYPEQNSKYIDELFDNPSKFKDNAENQYNKYPTSINELGKTPPNNYPAQILDSIKVAIIAEVGLGIYGWEKMFDFLGNELNNFLDFIAPQWIKDIIAQLYDPLALDLDGDGAISLIADKTGSVYFDHYCDGVAFRSSWVSPNDGILVFDRNNNGLIDNGSELFGNFTPLSNSTANSNL